VGNEVSVGNPLLRSLLQLADLLEEAFFFEFEGRLEPFKIELDTKQKFHRHNSWKFYNLLQKLVGDEGLEPPTSAM
jgi:hypothetical protein